MKKRIINSIIAFVGLVALVLMAIGFGWIPYSWYNQAQGTAPENYGGDNVQLLDGGMGFIDGGKPIMVAPKPLAGGFRNAQCDLTTTGGEVIGDLAPNTWQRGSDTSTFTYTTITGSWADVPSAPQGTASGAGARVGDAEGSVLIMGHVNYNFPNHNKLSNYGNLHRAQPCESIFATDENGTVSEYKVTSLYTVDSGEFKNHSEFFQSSGEHIFRLVTCSGAMLVDDDGNIISGEYEENLILEAKKVEVNG